MSDEIVYLPWRVIWSLLTSDPDSRTWKSAEKKPPEMALTDEVKDEANPGSACWREGCRASYVKWQDELQAKWRKKA